jgi:small-conductance mechanosensitive channel
VAYSARNIACVPDPQQILDELRSVGLWVVLAQVLLIIVLTFIALRFAHGVVAGALRRLFEREAVEGSAQQRSAVEMQRRRQTLEDLCYRALRVIILVIAFLMVLQVLRLDIGPAIAGLGIVGLALSLGSQSLVRDYVAGAFVLIENQYSKGDVVQIAGETGTVEDISLRRTVLRDEDGTVHYVPHGLIQTASNLSRNWAGISMDIPVPYEEDLARVTEAIDAAGETLATDPKWRNAVFEKPHVSRIEKLGETGLVVHVTGSVAAIHRFTLPGLLRGLILAEASKRGLVIGYRAVPERDQRVSNQAATVKDSAKTV